ncbi:MAG TPA: hypothetical protein VNE39_04300 [Planctomycetota bacterium]|nr:hypothetical protein [Planctomycetota bacterium]
MANYGGYETVSRLGHSPQAETWTARAAGAEADDLEQHVVKVYHPIELGFVEEASAGCAEFLEAAQLQGAVAQAKPDHWAPIQAAGSTEDEAFYVTAYYTHSAEDLTRVHLDTRTLHRIISSAVQGLLDLQEVAHRPHGNLKSTNVLIATGEDVSKMRVQLTDPLPGAKLDPRAAALADIRGLGLLLHRLAVQRQPAAKGPQLVPAAEGWGRLGRKGRAWRELCTQLLMTPESVVLEQVSAELARLYEAPTAAWRLPVLVGGVAALLLAAAALYVFVLRPPKSGQGGAEETWAKGAWEQVCDAQYKWFAKFLDDMSPARRSRWRAEPPLDAVVKALDDAASAGCAFDPRDIAGKPGATLEDLRAWAPGPQKVKEVNAKVRLAAEAIETIRSVLSPEQWPKLRDHKTLAEAWSSRGWVRPARYVAHYVDAVRPDASLASSADRFLEFASSRSVASAEAAWSAMQECQKKLTGSGDKVAATFLKWAQEEGRSEGPEGSERDVEDLLKKLQVAQSIGADLAKAVDDMAAKQVDRDRFLASASVHTAFDGTVMEHTLRRWLKEVRDYYYLAPDPRGTAEDWSKRTAKVAGDIAELEKLGDEGKGQAEKFRKALAGEVKAKIDAMWKLVPIRRDEHLVKRSADEAREGLQQLQTRVQGAIILFAGSSKEWLERTLKFEFASSPAIQAAWGRARNALLGHVKPEDLEADRDKYLALRNQVHRLRDALDRLDGEVPRDLPQSAQKHSGRHWYNAFLERARGKRDELLRTVIQKIAGGKEVPDLTSDEAVKFRAEAAQGFLRWLEELGTVIAAFSAIQDALDGCYLLAETPPGMAEPLGAAYQQWSQAPALRSEDDLKRALEPVAQRVAKLAEIGGMKDRAALAGRGVETGSREVVLAAWRALGALGDPAWPASPEELRTEGMLRQRLAAEFRSIADAARRDALQKEVVRGGQEREVRWLSTRLAALRQALDGAGDLVLAQFGKFVDGQLAGLSKDDPGPLLEKLNELKPLAEGLATVVEHDWPKKIARELFAKESVVHRDFESTKAEADKALFTRWLQEVKDYYYLDEADPLLRRRKAVGDEEANVRQALADLAKQNKAEADRLLARLESDVAPATRVPAVVKAKADLTARVTAAEKALPELTKGIGAVIEVIRLENEIAAKLKTVEASGDPILARLGEFVEREKKGIAAGDIAARRAKLAAIRNTAAQFEAIVRGDWAANRIHRTLFAKESKVHTGFQANPVITQATLDHWLAEVKEYYVLAPDPRGKKSDWDSQVKELEGLLARLEKFGGDYVGKAAGLRAELGKLVAESIGPLWTVEAVRKNEEKLVALVRAAGTRRNEFRAKVETAFEAEPQWRARIRKIEQVAKSDALNRTWRTRRDELLKTYSPEVLQASGDLYLTVRGRFDELVALLPGLDDPTALPPPPADWDKVLLAEGAKARESALEQAAAAIPRGADGFPAETIDQLKRGDRWKALCSAYSGTLATIARVQADAAQLQTLLDAGYLPDDKPEGATKTVQSILADWGKQAPPPALARAYDQTLQRARALLQLGASGRQQLVARAGQIKDTDPPQVPMLAWRGLGKVADWPTGLDELKLEARLREQLAALTAKLAAKDPHPVRWAAAELAKEGPRRWEACFNALVDRPGPKGIADSDLREAIALAPRLQVAPDALSPLTRFRWLLSEFRQQAFAAPETAKKEELLATLGAFEQKVSALPGGLAKQPATAALLKHLRDTLERAEEGGGASGLDKGGPAAARFSVQWTAAPAPDGKSATYSWEAKAHRLAFVRVEPRGGGGRAVYLCTTEASLGLVFDVVAAAGGWQDLMALLGAERLSGIDPRRGPRVWQPTRGQSAIQPTREWLVALPGVALYPADSVAPPPTRAHPIQYVSPEAALYVARLVGCRLPTSVEWAGAFDAFEKGAAPAGRNLRDKAWLQQRDHAAKQAGRLDYPDAGIFVAADAPAAPRAGAEAAPVVADSDGVLWFAAPDVAPGMQHLVGNVAELVYDDSARLDQALKQPDKPSAKAVRDLVGQGAGALKVVGASALSPPEYWDGKQRPFDRAYAVDLERARQGFSDVGFRLAFTAPVDPPAARLAAVLKEHGYATRPR